MLTIEDVKKAAGLIADRVLRTPLIYSQSLSRQFGADVYLKLENLQLTGSFKIRGALYKLLSMKAAIPPAGVVAASAGNHAQGVALAAREAGVEATIVMPQWASITKQEATRGYGGKVVIAGGSVEESIEKAEELAREGRMLIHPFDDWDVMAGQGTVALEIFQDLDGVDMLLVPVGGGGLVSGIAAVTRGLKPDATLVGVQSAACPAALAALEKGRVTRIDARSPLADGISVKQIGERNFEMIRRCVDRVVAVDEEQIAAAMLLLLERRKILAEGAGAAPLAALMGGALEVPRGGRVVLLVSGGNVDSPLLDRILRKGLGRNGRIMRLSVSLEDVPGSLARLLSLVAALDANVLHILHDRKVPDLPIHVTCVELELETRGHEHVSTVAKELRRAGYDARLR
jgi:threonine dehydratase